MFKQITFIGMGEAGGAIVSGWGDAQKGKISAYDTKTDNPETAVAMHDRYRELEIRGCLSSAEAVAEAEIVFSTVTADQAVVAAEAAAPYIPEGLIWCDLNSCAPSSKQKAAAIIEAAGGYYIDVAVMSPVFPKKNLVPLLIAGAYAEKVAPMLASLPMAPRYVGVRVGAASSIKMVRSIMVKGLEALTSECLLAAVAAGVEGEVLASLNASHPGIKWDAQAAYNFERAMVHGKRRASEMDEVVKMLGDLKLPSDMAGATVLWQRRIAEAGVEPPRDPVELGAKAVAESLLPEIQNS